MTPYDTIHPKEDVTIWKEQVQGSSVSVRGRGKINAPYDVVMGLIRDSEQKKTWDEQFISADVIDDRLPTTRVQTESFRGIWYECTLYVHLFLQCSLHPLISACVYQPPPSFWVRSSRGYLVLLLLQRIGAYRCLVVIARPCAVSVYADVLTC